MNEQQKRNVKSQLAAAAVCVGINNDKAVMNILWALGGLREESDKSVGDRVAKIRDVIVDELGTFADRLEKGLAELMKIKRRLGRENAKKVPRHDKLEVTVTHLEKVERKLRGGTL